MMTRISRCCALLRITGLLAALALLLPAAALAEENPEGYNVKWSNGLKIERNDGQHKLKIGGRIMGDFASIHPSAALNAAVAGGDGEGVEFRRARLFVSGELFKRVIFKAQYDFADTGGVVKLKDMYIGLKGLGPVGTVRVGHMKEPIGLEELTSSKYITFMERALPSIFDSSRNFGIMANNPVLDSKMTWAVGIFAPTDDQGDFFSQMTRFNATGRLTGLPYYSEDGSRLVHVGAGLSYQYARNLGASISQRPESHIAQKYLNTGTHQRDSQTILDVEIAWVHGPFSLQGEYTQDWVNRTAGASTLSFKGGYVEASYFLTGEHRAYIKKSGTFGRVKPSKSFDPGNGGCGAWQLAVRYSAMDLQDGGVNGGVEKNLSGGVNWHLFSNTRLMFNYVWADVDDAIGNVAADGSVHIFQSRAQIDF